MVRKEIYSTGYILPLIGKNNPDAFLDGDLIHVQSLRLQTFKIKGLTCVTCGCKGVFFAKEKDHKSEKYHLNLYAILEGGKEMLMTKDHILAKSKNGKDHLKNLQTMCSQCNCKKGNSPDESKNKNNPSS